MTESEKQHIHNQRDIEELMAVELDMQRQDVKRVVDTLWKTIHNEVEQGIVIRFQGVGRFYLSERGEHPARNLQTGEDIMINRHHTLRFSPSRTYAKRLRLKTEIELAKTDSNSEPVDAIGSANPKQTKSSKSSKKARKRKK